MRMGVSMPTFVAFAAGVTDVIVSDAVGTRVTVTTNCPLRPSLVAVIVAVPAVMPVIKPAGETVAIVALLDAQVTTRPVRTFPVLSLVCAVAWSVAPMANEDNGAVTDTEATGIPVTVTTAVPVLVAAVAVIVAVPAVAPVTTPACVTLAMFGALLCHPTAGAGVQFDAATLAVNDVDAPTTTEVADGTTVTEETKHSSPALTGSLPASLPQDSDAMTAHTAIPALRNRIVGIDASPLLGKPQSRDQASASGRP